MVIFYVISRSSSYSFYKVTLYIGDTIFPYIIALSKLFGMNYSIVENYSTVVHCQGQENLNSNTSSTSMKFKANDLFKLSILIC